MNSAKPVWKNSNEFNKLLAKKWWWSTQANPFKFVIRNKSSFLPWTNLVNYRRVLAYHHTEEVILAQYLHRKIQTRDSVKYILDVCLLVTTSNYRSMCLCNYRMSYTLLWFLWKDIYCIKLLFCSRFNAIELLCIIFHTFLCNGDVSVCIIEFFVLKTRCAQTEPLCVFGAFLFETDFWQMASP